jgi:hypothetical protein
MSVERNIRRDGRSKAVIFTDVNAVREYKKRRAMAETATTALNSLDSLRAEVERLKTVVEGMQKEIRCLQDKT